MDFDFGSVDKQMYGNVENDEELLAELMALEAEEMGATQGSTAVGRVKASAASSAVLAEARRVAMTADPISGEAEDGDADNLEDDDELLAELSNLVGPDTRGNAPLPAPSVSRAAPPPPIPPRSASTSSSTSASAPSIDANKINELRNLQNVYKDLVKTNEAAGEGPKARRQQRAVDKIAELIGKLEKGQKIDESEIPPAPPSFPAKQSIAAPSSHSAAPSIRAAAASDLSPPPPLPVRAASASMTTPSMTPSSSSAILPNADPKAEIRAILVRRRNAYVANGKAAIKAEDKSAAKGFVESAKQFDEAIAALEQVSADEIDLDEIPPTPPPYRKKEAPKKVTNFVEGLEYRQTRYKEMADRAKQTGDDRKFRMYNRMVGQYADALKQARAGRPVDVNELPSLPDMPPLPQQPGTGKQPPMGQAMKNAGVGSTANRPAISASSAATANSDLQFLIQRQNEFKQAAIVCKQRGDIASAKKYLIDAKGFDPMIAAARAGQRVSIKQTPIPPQLQTSTSTLQPRIATAVATGSAASDTGGNRNDVLALLEKTLIEQIQNAEQSRMRFTRLGDVGKVKLFEGWAKSSKQDLLLVREVAKRRDLNVPKFHYEMRQAPSSHINPDLAEDALELTIISCRDVPLPAGYEMHHANLYVKYIFPHPSESPQNGKSKSIAATCSPEFNETIMLNIGTGKTRGTKTLRILKRTPLKIEVYQKGSFLRSDKLLGTCDWKIDALEHASDLEESLPLKEGRKAIGGLCTMRIRVREPLGDAKQQLQQVKWLVLDN